MTFGTAIFTCLGKYADFRGRASRAEYWWFVLFGTLASVIAKMIDKSMMLYGILVLILWLPSLAAATRRLHDTGRSGWWQLLPLTIIGLIPYIYWMVSKGENKENQYDT